MPVAPYGTEKYRTWNRDRMRRVRGSVPWGSPEHRAKMTDINRKLAQDPAWLRAVDCAAYERGRRALRDRITRTRQQIADLEGTLRR